jgi:hypothetical protein
MSLVPYWANIVSHNQLRALSASIWVEGKAGRCQGMKNTLPKFLLEISVTDSYVVTKNSSHTVITSRFLFPTVEYILFEV